MNYFPILQELLESDLWKFLPVGIVLAVAVGVFLQKKKHFLVALAVSAAVYAVCELLSNFHTNFLVEILLLFVGTAALGCCIGFLGGLFLRMVRKARS
jgi:NhaP-type Na+/H+ or K+/H+ antiporter